MAGKPTIPASVLRRIKTLDRKGASQSAIAETVGCSRNTVRRTLDPDYALKERERHRARAAEQYAARKNDPDYQAYQAAANKTDAHRERVRLKMAELRSARKRV